MRLSYHRVSRDLSHDKHSLYGFQWVCFLRKSIKNYVIILSAYNFLS